MPATLQGDFTKFPEPFRAVIPLIAGEVCQLRLSWAVYARLFMEDRANTDRYVEYAGDFLGMVQDLLQDRMFLSVSRFTDPDTRVQSNLSLWTLVTAAGASGDSLFANSMKSELEALCQFADDVRKHRHKRIAHFDLSASVGQTTLPTVTFAQLRTLIEMIEAFVNQFNFRYQKVTTVFKILPADDVTAEFETIIAKAITYDRLEESGSIPMLEWMRDRRGSTLGK